MKIEVPKYLDAASLETALADIRQALHYLASSQVRKFDIVLKPVTTKAGSFLVPSLGVWFNSEFQDVKRLLNITENSGRLTISLHSVFSTVLYAEGLKFSQCVERHIARDESALVAVLKEAVRLDGSLSFMVYTKWVAECVKALLDLGIIKASTSQPSMVLDRESGRDIWHGLWYVLPRESAHFVENLTPGNVKRELVRRVQIFDLKKAIDNNEATLAKMKFQLEALESEES